MQEIKPLEYDIDNEDPDLFKRISEDQIQYSIDVIVNDLQKNTGTIFKRLEGVIDKDFSSFLFSIIQNIEKKIRTFIIFF